MTEARALAAHHEAGHVVAACMRGGAELRSVTIHASDGSGLTQHRAKAIDLAWIAYGGPWAEARFQWPPGVPVDDLDGMGLAFDDYLDGVLLGQPDDGRFLTGETTRDEEIWRGELEEVWPVIQVVASRLLDGAAVTGERVESLLAEQVERP